MCGKCMCSTMQMHNLAHLRKRANTYTNTNTLVTYTHCLYFFPLSFTAPAQSHEHTHTQTNNNKNPKPKINAKHNKLANSSAHKHQRTLWLLGVHRRIQTDTHTYVFPFYLTPLTNIQFGNPFYMLTRRLFGYATTRRTSTKTGT